MNDPHLLHTLLLASEGMVAASLLPLLAWLTASCFPKWAALRHLIWMIAFIGLLVLPIATWLLPSHFVINQPTAPITTSSIAVTTEGIGPTAGIRESVSIVSTRAAVGSPAFIASMARISHALTPGRIAGTALALWLLGIGAVLLYQMTSLLGLCCLRLRSRAHDIPISELEGPWHLRVATQPTTHGPLTWGFFRPVILLPLNALNWPRERLAAALHHEIAHVRRHDKLTQTLAQLVCALYWPNPFVWLGLSRLRQEAEIAADDAVLAAGMKPSSYADALIALAAEFRGGSAGLAMAAPSALEMRIKSVLAPTQSHMGVTVMDVLKTACLGTAAIVLIALARPDLAIAQVAAQPATPVARNQVIAPTDSKAAAALAKADAIKAKVDALAAQVQKKAEAESDPVKRKQVFANAAAAQLRANQIMAESNTINSLTLKYQAMASAIGPQAAVLKAQVDQLVLQAEADPTNSAKAEAARAAADAMTKAQAAEFKYAQAAANAVPMSTAGVPKFALDDAIQNIDVPLRATADYMSNVTVGNPTGPESHEADWTGNVEITQGSITLHADSARIFTANGVPGKIYLSGHVTFASATDKSKLAGENVIYDVGSHLVTLDPNPK